MKDTAYEKSWLFDPIYPNYSNSCLKTLSPKGRGDRFLLALGVSYGTEFLYVLIIWLGSEGLS